MNIQFTLHAENKTESELKEWAIEKLLDEDTVDLNDVDDYTGFEAIMEDICNKARDEFGAKGYF